MRLVWPACCGALLLAGCATPRLSHVPLTALEQEALLRDLSGFRLQGRAGVQAGADGFNASLSWRQQASESQLQLGGPLGAGSLILVYSPEVLRVTTSHGEKLEGAEAEQVLSEQLGFVPPFAALRFWVLGLVAPGEAPVAQVTDDMGRIAEMTQQGWRIHYDRWIQMATRVGEVRLPQRLTATHADLKLRLVTDRWQLQSAN